MSSNEQEGQENAAQARDSSKQVSDSQSSGSLSDSQAELKKQKRAMLAETTESVLGEMMNVLKAGVEGNIAGTETIE